MTLNELLSAGAEHPGVFLGVFLLVPVLPLALRLAHGAYEGWRPPWKYIYSVIVYVTCVPGTFMTVAVLYSVLFLGANVLELSIPVYFVPIISMTATLVFLRRNVELRLVPGFRRLSGLLLIMGASFFIVYALDRLRIWAFFGGSLAVLAVAAVVLFLLLKWGVERLFG